MYKAIENIKSMGYEVSHKYKIKGYGVADIRGEKITPAGYEHVLVKVKKANYHVILLRDFIRALSQLSRFHTFYPAAKLIIAFEAGAIKLDDDLLTLLEQLEIQPMQLTPPEHPTAGPDFFESTIKG